MSRYCLDTSAYSHFKRGHAEAAEMIDRAEWIGMPTVVLGELYAGFKRGSRRKQNEAELAAFLSEPVVEVLAVDHDVARIFGDVLAELRRLGKPLPVNDVWIAATCARSGATLLTFDDHFRKIPRVDAVVLKAE